MTLKSLFVLFSLTILGALGSIPSVTNRKTFTFTTFVRFHLV
jgi:hypothetical protein